MGAPQAPPSSCPICLGNQLQKAYVCDGMDLYDCAGCTHRFSWLKVGAEPYDADYFDEAHKAFFENPDVRLYERALQRLETYAPRGGRILDVGCGVGNFVEFLVQRNYQATGIDVAASAIQKGLDRGLELQACTLEAYVPEAPLDGVTSFYVLEHLDELQLFMADTAAPLKTNGLVMFTTVDSDSLLFALARGIYTLSAGIIRSPLQRMCDIHHLQHFTKRSLAYLLEKHGFTLLERFGVDLPLGTVTLTAFQHLAVGTLYGVGNLVNSHYGQVVIARKR